MKDLTIYKTDRCNHYDVHAYGDPPIRISFGDLVWMLTGTIAMHEQTSLLRICRNKAYRIIHDVEESRPIRVSFEYVNGTRPEVMWHEPDQGEMLHDNHADLVKELGEWGLELSYSYRRHCWQIMVNRGVTKSLWANCETIDAVKVSFEVYRESTPEADPTKKDPKYARRQRIGD